MSSEFSSQNIIIIYGGRSGEHEVSLESAASVIRHLDPRRYRLELIGIDKEGRWFRQAQSVLADCRAGKPLHIRSAQPVLIQPGGGIFYARSKSPNAELLPLTGDLVFPVLHGTFGEDGSIQGLLDMLGIAYVGSGVLGSSLSMDKEKTKQVWMQDGLPVIPYKVFQTSNGDDIPSGSKLEDLWRTWTQALGQPLFIKPARLGSSVGISRATNSQELLAGLKEALLYDHKVLIETAVQARELETSVLGNLKPRVFPPGEVKPNHEFYDYEAKYLDPEGAQLLIPAPVPEDVVARIKGLAIRAYKAAEARGLARVDFFYDEEQDKLYLNEINTMPGFTSISMYPKLAEAGGLPYAALIDELITLAREEFARRDALSYSR